MKPSSLNQFVSNKEIFDLWIELGTLTKVERNLAGRGIINKYTGKPLVYTSVWERAMRWVLYNPDEAKVIYETKLQRELSQEQWERWLVKKALKIFDDAQGQLKNWIKTYGMEQHSDIYSKRFPGGTLD